MGRGHEEADHEILVLGRHAGAALAAAALGPIGRERHALDPAGVGHGDDHVLAGDQILVVDVAVELDDLGAPRGGELGPHLGELGLDDRQHPVARGEDLEIIGDLGGELLEFLGDLVAAEGGEALQTQVEDGAGLFLGETIGAVLGHDVTRIGDERDQRLHVLGRPGALHQLGARGRRIRRGSPSDG